LPSAGFGKSKRLLTSSDFTGVFDSARFKVGHKNYLLLATPGSGSETRLGLVISKKNARLATHRNRIKRVVRETFRKHSWFNSHLDIVFLVRQGFDTLPPALQTKLMEEAWKRLAMKTGDSH
jgi:ribonuclease P protein component